MINIPQVGDYCSEIAKTLHSAPTQLRKIPQINSFFNDGFPYKKICKR